MKKFGLLTGILLMSQSINVAPASSSPLGSRTELRITNGQLYRDGKLVLGDISMVKTELDYIFYYIPDFGLVTVASARFPGGEEKGSFHGRQLSFNANGADFVLKSSAPIIGEKDSPAWISVDTKYALGNKSAFIAYGDDLQDPYRWPMYRGK